MDWVNVTYHQTINLSEVKTTEAIRNGTNVNPFSETKTKKVFVFFLL